MRDVRTGIQDVYTRKEDGDGEDGVAELHSVVLLEDRFLYRHSQKRQRLPTLVEPVVTTRTHFLARSLHVQIHDVTRAM